VHAPRRRSRSVTAPLAAALALVVSGCGTTDQAQGVCREERTDRRVDDEQCRRGVPGFGFWYFLSGARYPAIGQAVSPLGGSATPQAGARVVQGGAPVAGGTVARGGFGGRGGGVGG
jgi:hypothetical protein